MYGYVQRKKNSKYNINQDLLAAVKNDLIFAELVTVGIVFFFLVDGELIFLLVLYI